MASAFSIVFRNLGLNGLANTRGYSQARGKIETYAINSAAQASLEGTWDLADGLSFRPIVELFYLREDVDSYVVEDDLGNTALVNGFVTEQLRLSAGGSLHFVLETDGDLVVRPNIGAQVGMSLVDGELTQFASLAGGVDISGTGSWTLGLSTRADLGAVGLRALSAKVALGVQF